MRCTASAAQPVTGRQGAVRRGNVDRRETPGINRHVGENNGRTGNGGVLAGGRRCRVACS